jgi:hypothetical protein
VPRRTVRRRAAGPPPARDGTQRRRNAWIHPRRHDTINGPAITVPPLQAKVADARPSGRNAIVDAIDRLHHRTGATEFARRDIVAEVQASGTQFERQTIYRCLRRMTGHEPGSAYHDLDDLGNDRLRLRA